MKLDKPDAVAMYSRGVLLDVVRERFRQEDLKAEGKFNWSCSDAQDHTGRSVTDNERLVVLAEEFGEVAHEVSDALTNLSLEHLGIEQPSTIGGDAYNKSLRNELVQVAAVAVAWIEAIDRRE